jgi:hypothetical protein
MPSQDFKSTPANASFTYGNVGTQPASPAHPGFVHDLKATADKPLPVAVLVCHGMGQQVRYETIGQLGASILNAAKQHGCTIHPNGVELALQNDDFLVRAELNWTDPAGALTRSTSTRPTGRPSSKAKSPTPTPFASSSWPPCPESVAAASSAPPSSADGCSAACRSN